MHDTDSNVFVAPDPDDGMVPCVNVVVFTVGGRGGGPAGDGVLRLSVARLQTKRLRASVDAWTIGDMSAPLEDVIPG